MRPEWNKYFIDMAVVVSSRASCPRRSVGCLIVSVDHRILGSGYNGAPAHLPHCIDLGCDLVEGHCVRANHAETNAISHAAKYGVSINGASAYITTYPCWPCFRQLISAGIKKVVFKDIYRPDERVANAARLAGVHIEMLA